MAADLAELLLMGRDRIDRGRIGRDSKVIFTGALPMKAFEAASTVEQDQAVRVQDVPFAVGTEVEVVIIPRRRPAAEFAALWNSLCQTLRRGPQVATLDDAAIEQEVRDFRAGR